MSLPVCTTVSGHRLAEGAAAEPADRARLHADDRTASGRPTSGAWATSALDGRFELYKTSAEHEGDVGRKQHGFPSQEEVSV